MGYAERQDAYLMGPWQTRECYSGECVRNVTDLYGDSAAASSGLVCRWSVSLFYLVSSKWLRSEVIFLIHTNDMSLFILCIYFC